MLFAGFIGFVFRGLFLFSTMIEKLNQRLPANKEYNLIGFWTLNKRQQFWAEWRQHFSEDSLARSYRMTQIFAFVFWAAIAVLVFSWSRL